MSSRFLSLLIIAVAALTVGSGCTKCKKEDPIVEVRSMLNEQITYTVSSGESGTLEAYKSKSFTTKPAYRVYVTVKLSSGQTIDAGFEAKQCYEHRVRCDRDIDGVLHLTVYNNNLNDDGARGYDDD